MHLFLKISNGKVDDYFTQCILMPLTTITHSVDSPPMIIAIDALDEIDVNYRNGILNIIKKCLRYLPKWVKIIVTSRPENDILDQFTHFTPEVISAEDPNHLQDLKIFIESQLILFLENPCELDQATSLLMSKSEGKFIYIAMLVEDNFTPGVKISLKDLDRLKSGLYGKYEEYFDRIQLNDSVLFHSHVRPLLSLLVTMLEPLTENDAKSLLHVQNGKDEWDFKKACYLIKSTFPIREGRFYPYHKTVVEWLINREVNKKYHINSLEGHQLFAQELISRMNITDEDHVVFPPSGDYMYAHLLDHLDACNQQHQSVELLYSLPWLMKTVDERGGAALLKDIENRIEYDSSLKILASTIQLSLEYLQVELKLTLNYNLL